MERESTDDDCCHSSEQERDRRQEKKETSSQREKRDRDRKEDRLTIDVHHCLTSKTDKTLND